MSRLSRDDWAAAALDALSTGGVRAVAVEPLAVRLGTTKGSFYWHFQSRQELLEAALALWERVGTLDVIREIESGGLTPDKRLRRLFDRAFDPWKPAGADVVLLGHADEPLVRAAVERVTAKRIAYLARLLRECGVPAPAARRRAVLVYSSFIGHVQLMHGAPDVVRRSVGSLRRYGDEVLASLVAPVDTGR